MSRTSLPDVESLRCFEAACRLPTFRAAAAEVSLSPAAFSERIRRLEEELGQSLLDRHARKVAVTRAGRALLPHARACLAAARACRESLDPGQRTALTLTLGTRHELGMSWLMPAIEVLQEDRPERRFHMAFGSGSGLMEELRGGRVDAVISSARLIAKDLETYTLHPEHYAFVSSGLLIEEQPLRGPDDAASHRLVDSTDELPLFRYFLGAWPGSEPWTFKDHEYLGTIEAIRRRVRTGVGVAVLPRYYVRDDLARGDLGEILPRVNPLSDAFRLIWRRGHPETSEFEALGQELSSFELQ